MRFGSDTILGRFGRSNDTNIRIVVLIAFKNRLIHEALVIRDAVRVVVVVEWVVLAVVQCMVSHENSKTIKRFSG